MNTQRVLNYLIVILNTTRDLVVTKSVNFFGIYSFLPTDAFMYFFLWGGVKSRQSSINNDIQTNFFAATATHVKKYPSVIDFMGEACQDQTSLCTDCCCPNA